MPKIEKQRTCFISSIRIIKESCNWLLRWGKKWGGESFSPQKPCKTDSKLYTYFMQIKRGL